MKKLNVSKKTCLVLLLFSYINSFASFGIFESYVILNGTYYDLFATTVNPDFNGANLGTFNTSGTLTFNGGEIKTFKESRNSCQSNVCGGTIFYVIRLGGSPIGNGSVNLNYNNGYGNQNNGACSVNQQWDNSSGMTNLISGLSSGNYTLEVHCEATGSNSSNSGCGETVSQGVLTASFTVESAMPVELSTFDLRKYQYKTHLTWSTASELNNSHFDIQRSADSRNWETIGTVQGNGTTLEPQEYDFTDREPLPGMNYYRLWQVDYDGNFEYSKVISMDFNNGGRPPEIYPNPASKELFLRLPEAGENSLSATIFDLNGRAWIQQTLSNNAVNVSTLPEGVYFIKVETESRRVLLRERFIKN